MNAKTRKISVTTVRWHTDNGQLYAWRPHRPQPASVHSSVSLHSAYSPRHTAPSELLFGTVCSRRTAKELPSNTSPHATYMVH